MVKGVVLLLQHVPTSLSNPSASLVVPPGMRVYGRVEETVPGDKIPRGTISASILFAVLV